MFVVSVADFVLPVMDKTTDCFVELFCVFD